MHEAVNDSAGLEDKIVKYRPLSKPMRLQDLEDPVRSQPWKKFVAISISAVILKLMVKSHPFSADTGS